MSSFILAWVLMNMDAHGAISYSPPVKTVEDCQRLQKFILDRSYNHDRSQCIQVNVLARGKE